MPVRLLYACLLLVLLAAQVPAKPAWQNDHWLLQQYHAGNFDTLETIVDSIHVETAAGQFLRGIFEPDGEEAIFYFDRIVSHYPNSFFEAPALERLWQYHLTKGDRDQAKKFWDFLKRREPDYPNLNQKPDFKMQDGLVELIQDNMEAGAGIGVESDDFRWTVQLGAFSELERAQALGRQMNRYGSVFFVDKFLPSGKLTAVQIGRYHARSNAEETMRRILDETGVEGRVMPLER